MTTDGERRPVRAGGLRVRAYPVLCDAVEAGVRSGLYRFYKHRDDEPAADVTGPLAEQVASSVVDAICEAFEIDEPTDD